MAIIPNSLKSQAVIPSLKSCLIGQGKVGDKYYHPTDDDLLISVRSDRISVFDFVLPFTVPRKGEVLTALPHHFATALLAQCGIANHLVGSEKYPGYNLAKDLADDFPDIDLKRTMVVREHNIVPFELIFRKHIGGSVWDEFLETGAVAGHVLPLGFKKWQGLDSPIFTPSTKEEFGHDINQPANAFYERYGEAGQKAVRQLTELYISAYNLLDWFDVNLLDTKFEISFLPDGDFVLCDEWLTPDSSRFVEIEELESAILQGREPAFLDKQPVRDFCAKIETPFKNEKGRPIVGFKGLDPTNLEHVAFVANYSYPPEIAIETSERYLNIFHLVTGLELDTYQEYNIL